MDILLYKTKLKNATEEADKFVSELPLQTPPHLRDRLFEEIVSLHMVKSHTAESCPVCIEMAARLAVISTNNLITKTSCERMDEMLERMTEALAYLNKIHREPELC